MTIQSYTHIVTTTEIDEIKSLGYQLSGLSGQEADFINKHFPNFDIYKLLKEVDDLFSPVSQRPTEKMLILDANSLCLQFYYVTDDYEDAATGLTFARSISLSNGEVTINNDFLDCLRLPVGKE